MSAPLVPVLCSCLLLLCWVLCAWGEPQRAGHKRIESWNPETPFPPGLLLFASGRDISPPFQQCNPVGSSWFQPQAQDIFNSFVSHPSHLYRAKDKLRGDVLWNAQRCSLSRASPVMWAVCGAPGAELCVCAVPGAAQQQCLGFVCVWLRVGMCVCVSKVGCLNALLHYVNSSAVQSNSCRN